MPDTTIYKICTRQEWAEAERCGEFAGSAVDIADGYIHFSTAQQVAETARRHFARQPDLVLVAVDTERLPEGLRWEESRGGDLFPHLYTTLPTAAAMNALPLPWKDGRHVFPDHIPDSTR